MSQSAQTAPEPGQPATAPPTGAPAPTPPAPPAQPPATGQSVADDGKGGKDAVLADLARERDARQELQKQLEGMQTAQQEQSKALAAIFGVKPEETSDADKLAQTVTSLQEQIAAANRRAVSAATKVPESMLTATDLAGMEAQAAALVEFANGAAYAASIGGAAAPQTPGFVTSAGQGNNGGTPAGLPAQIAAAEAETAAAKPGTPEHRAAQQKVMNLKSQQLASLS